MPAPVKTLLLILDGWGIAPDSEGNCVTCACTPTLDELAKTYPSTELACSGRAVGLPDGFMGNSEVGHMNIGAGRVVYQDMTRIDMSIDDGSLFRNQVLVDLAAKVSARSGRLHLMGLVSDGGVHSHQNHIYALLDFARQQGIREVLVHAFMDGRDTPPTSGAGYLEQLADFMNEHETGVIASVTGRYWAMDRDKRYERVEQAWKMLVDGDGMIVDDPVKAVRDAYEEGKTDEFIKPRQVAGVDHTVRDGDGIFFFNFRADRAREICTAFFSNSFDEFERKSRPELAGFATMTRYESSFPMPVAFPPDSYEQTLGEVISSLGWKQLRIAETEKYAHVTYFLNCGREEPFDGEDREMVPSPREVDTYDQKPQMSAEEVTEKLVARLPEYDLCVCNLANLDMVGHTGIIPAATQACEVVDGCVGRIVKAMLDLGGQVLLTADHGNAEEMIDQNGGPQTAHSTNPVPLLFISGTPDAYTLSPGKLGDIAPTILDLLGVDKPQAMTGNSLITEKQ
ncbi:2,3-bisphosphoglycerate-independent phosphoglycerate mutase [Salidesulfovibrio brasiliensis]|uniref:2,3-bisphosphoglycerate-independent phosphoglycerate mutase n=1 Tax=Salidesulfovibrio brasiliensis TaxID=221711 RepID=UPI0006D012FF|nr:2,3-bisphosphoglycerate-independent phosphoglycerate mutase [Salidesulfovibrio brasiliensis]